MPPTSWRYTTVRGVTSKTPPPFRSHARKIDRPADLLASRTFLASSTVAHSSRILRARTAVGICARSTIGEASAARPDQEGRAAAEAFHIVKSVADHQKIAFDAAELGGGVHLTSVGVREFGEQSFADPCQDRSKAAQSVVGQE